MITRTFHPLAEIFPLLEGQAFEELVSDIKLHGIREPMWLYQGRILDGRNRYRAAVRLGLLEGVAALDVLEREYDGDDPLAFVISANLHRRQLTDSQRSLVAAKIADLKEGRPPETAAKQAVSQPRAAELLNVKRGSVQRARQVIDKGAPELVKAVERGEVKVGAAAAVIDASAEEQAQAAAKGAKGVRALKKKMRAVIEAPKPKEPTRQERQRQEIEQALFTLRALETLVLTHAVTPAKFLALGVPAAQLVYRKGKLMQFLVSCMKLLERKRNLLELLRRVQARRREWARVQKPMPARRARKARKSKTVRARSKAVEAKAKGSKTRKRIRTAKPATTVRRPARQAGDTRQRRTRDRAKPATSRATRRVSHHSPVSV